MYELLRSLFPIHRTLVSGGTRATLERLAVGLPNTRYVEYATGARVGDWEIPHEWDLREARITDEEGNVVVDVRDSNLHVVQYSSPLDCWVTREQLDDYVYVADDPTAIPYVTSYYKQKPGFCLTREKLQSLPSGRYHLLIDSQLLPSSLRLLECVIQGRTDQEVLLWTYVCHPSMANNELSGPVVQRAVAEWLANQDHHYTYRLVWSVETIGAIAYMSDHLIDMQRMVVAGLVLNCLGGPGQFGLISTPSGNRWVDRATRRALTESASNSRSLPYLRRDSDERQFSSGRADLPVVGLFKTKPAEYKEYHTSKDDLDYVTPTQLGESFVVVRKIIEHLESFEERNFPISNFVGEPFLSKRSLYPTESRGTREDFAPEFRSLVNHLAHCNGRLSIADIAELCSESSERSASVVEQLAALGLVTLDDSIPVAYR